MSTHADNLKSYILSSHRTIINAIHNAQTDVISKIESELLHLMTDTKTATPEEILTRALAVVGRVRTACYEASRASERALYEAEKAGRE